MLEMPQTASPLLLIHCPFDLINHRDTLQGLMGQFNTTVSLVTPQLLVGDAETADAALDCCGDQTFDLCTSLVPFLV